MKQMMAENEKNRTWPAHVAILFANLSWALVAPISKSILLDGNISALALSGIRIAGGAVLFVLVSLFFPNNTFFNQKVRREDWLKILICSVLMISLNQGLFILGVGLTNPVDAAVMTALTPILTMILAAIFLRYPITLMKGSGVAIGISGVLILVLGSQAGTIASSPVLGDILCFLAQLCAAVYFVIFKDFISRYSPFTLMKWMFVLSAVTYVPICMPSIMQIDVSALSSEIFWEIAYIIVFATTLSYLAIPYAQKYLSPTTIPMYSYFQPVAATIATVIMGVGTFSVLKGVATLLIFAGVFFVNRSSTRTIPTASRKPTVS